MTEITELDGRDAEAVTVWFDGSCALCRAEIAAIRSHAASAALVFVDCAAADFDVSTVEQHGITRDALMKALHVRDSAGVWATGVDAFSVLYRSAGLHNIAGFWAHPVVNKVAARLYPWIADNRYWLSRIGLPRVTEVLIGVFARRAARRSARCADGACSIR